MYYLLYWFYCIIASCLSISDDEESLCLQCVGSDSTVLHRRSLESAEGKPSRVHSCRADDSGHKAGEESEQLVSSFGWKNSNTAVLWLRPLERALGRSHTGQTDACLTFTVSRGHGWPSERDLCARVPGVALPERYLHVCDTSQNRTTHYTGGGIRPSAFHRQADVSRPGSRGLPGWHASVGTGLVVRQSRESDGARPGWDSGQCAVPASVWFTGLRWIWPLWHSWPL